MMSKVDVTAVYKVMSLISKSDVTAVYKVMSLTSIK